MMTIVQYLAWWGHRHHPPVLIMPWALQLCTCTQVCLCKELIKLYACTLQVGGGNWYTHVHGGRIIMSGLQFKLAVHQGDARTLLPFFKRWHPLVYMV